MSDLSCRTLIIGGGVIGLCIARQLLQKSSSSHSKYPELILIEREDTLGTHMSSRNSEVIHAGFYYPENSNKAVFCVRGRHLLVSYLKEHRIPFNPCGKWVIAPEITGRERLESLYLQGQLNDVEGLTLLTASEVKAQEPWLRADGGALSSSVTTIFDSHMFMRSLEAEIKLRGGTICCQHELVSLSHLNDQRFQADITAAGEQTFSLTAERVINATGCWSPSWVGSLGENLPRYEVKYALGRYWSLKGTAPTQRLIYPLPVAGGLGIHITLDLQGRVRFGPDVDWRKDEALQWNETIDYSIDHQSKVDFIKGIQSYWPKLDPSKLLPDYSGLRIKVTPLEHSESDFTLLGPQEHGVEGLVHLLGIESPGLTSALAIAEWVEHALN